MSKLEELIESEFYSKGISFEKQKPVPINNYPWKTNRSITSPKCDFYISKYDLYIEVKGFMTIEAMSKMAYLAHQSFRYYIFQGSEFEWNPYLMNTNPIHNNNSQNSKSVILKNNIEEQINEISTNNNEYFANISVTSYLRLKDFINKKIEQYKLWNGIWY